MTATAGFRSISKGARKALCGLLFLGALAGAAAAWAEVSDAQLVARSQALLDAVGSGDKAVWEAALADNGVFVSEDGAVRSKAEVLAEIAPLPAGFVGSIHIEAPKVTRSGDVAVLTYDAMETLHLYGQVLHTHFHTTDVYRIDGPEPQLIASQTSVLPAEAKPVGPSAPLADFAGAYRLGETERLVLAVEGGALVSTRGKARETLAPLGGDWFARPGRPRALRVFRRDAGGRVTGFVDRRDNGDLEWSKD